MAERTSQSGEMDEMLATIVKNLEIKEKDDKLYPIEQDLIFNVEKLMECDRELCKLAIAALKILEKMPKSRITPGDLTVSGSCAEGCMLARWFLDGPRPMPFHSNGGGTLESVLLNRRHETPVNITDIALKFLKGPEREQAEQICRMIFGAPPVYTQVESENCRTDWAAGSMDSGPQTSAPFRDSTNPDPWEIEVDVLGNIGTITKNCQQFLEPVEGKPAYVMLPYCDELKQCVQPKIWRKLQVEAEEGIRMDLNTGGYFDPQKIKRIIAILCIYRDNDRHLPLFLGWVFQVPAKNIISSVCSETTKTSHQMTINAKITDHISFNLASDYVGCFWVEFWPEVAREWITRKSRKWPALHVIEGIVKVGSQLVPRASPDGQQFKEFRWSFSHAEITLAKHMSKQQRRCYFVFKMMFYRYIKSLHKDLSSYMMKTTMLWVCEQYPPEHRLWSSTSLISTVRFLFGKLEHFFRKHYLPMFFMPQMNLFEGKIPPKTCNVIANRISEIRPNIHYLVPFDIPLVISAAKTQATAISRLIQLGEAATDKNAKLLIQMVLQHLTGDSRPELYSYNQAYQEEYTTFLALKKLRKRKLVAMDDDLD